MSKKLKIRWLKEPEDQDYPGAESYLSLIYDDDTASKIVNRLTKAKAIEFKAKDIFRASCLEILGSNNYHVAKDMKKIEKGIKLSPILLVRDTSMGKVVIADGYHRMCAVYLFDEDAIIPCKIV